MADEMQSTEVAVTPSPKTAASIQIVGGQFVPTTFDEAYRMAQVYAASDLVPKDYRGKPANIIVAIQKGAEIGLKPLQALDGIAVINGRAGVWGDLLWALVRQSRLVAGVDESFDDATMTAVCKIKRRDGELVMRTFSQKDAERAGLWGRDGTWRNYPRRMLQMRARAFAARDAVPDVLKGLAVLDEFVGAEPDQAAPAPALEVPRDAAPSAEKERGAVSTLRDRVVPKSEVAVGGVPAGSVEASPALFPDVPDGDPKQLTGKEIEG
jgi:hypothetical protein